MKYQEVQFDYHFDFYNLFCSILKRILFLAGKTGSGQIVVYEVSIGVGWVVGGSPRCQLARLDGAPTVRPSHYLVQREHGVEEGDILMMMAMTMKTCFVLFHSSTT